MSSPSITEFMISHPNFRESIILADAYNLTDLNSWRDAVYHQVCARLLLSIITCKVCCDIHVMLQVLILGNEDYLRDVQQYYLLTESFYLDLVQRFLRDPLRDAHFDNASILLEVIQDITLQYKIASQLGLSSFLHSLYELHPYLQDLVLIS